MQENPKPRGPIGAEHTAQEESPLVLQEEGDEFTTEEIQARRMADRLGIEYVDLSDFTIVHELFRNIPVDLMFRYNFVPLRREGPRLVIVVSDPSS